MAQLCRDSLLPPGPILNRFGQVRRGDVVTPREIGDGACDLEHAMKCSRTELQLLYRRAHQRLARRVELARCAHVGGPLRVSALHTTRES
jgi:hypothetical protein